MRSPPSPNLERAWLYQIALRALQATRLRTGLFGPDAVITAESVLDTRVDGDAAARMLTQAHVSLPVKAEIESPAPGTWRTANRRTVLQVSGGPERTNVAVVVSRRLTQLGLIGGGTWLGTFAGLFVVPSLAVAAGGSVEAIVLAQAAGAVGGAGAGFWAGRAAWAEAARRTQSRVLAAFERMRRAVEAGEGG